MNEIDEIGFYESLISEGCDICDLLTNNSANVGDIGELLILAANEIETLRTKLDSFIYGRDLYPELVEYFASNSPYQP